MTVNGCLVELHCRPDHAGIGIERAPPETVAQHHVGRRVGAMLIRRVEEPAHLRLDSQQIEIVAGDLDSRRRS